MGTCSLFVTKELRNLKKTVAHSSTYILTSVALCQSLAVLHLHTLISVTHFPLRPGADCIINDNSQIVVTVKQYVAMGTKLTSKRISNRKQSNYISNNTVDRSTMEVVT